jgi:hypothetical protein
MRTAAVGHCSQCDAVVNISWPSCLVCHASLLPASSPEAVTDWLAAWRELAAITSGLTVDDPRLRVVIDALNECDNGYLSGNWAAFREAAARVRSAVEGRNLRAEA